MVKMKQFTSEKLKTNPEQVQIFCPAPSTYSALMYYTGMDPFTGKQIFVEKNPQNKDRQKDIIVTKQAAAPFPGKPLKRRRF
jgi:ABC-type transporter MlaC component